MPQGCIIFCSYFGNKSGSIRLSLSRLGNLFSFVSQRIHLIRHGINEIIELILQISPLESALLTSFAHKIYRRLRPRFRSLFSSCPAARAHSQPRVLDLPRRPQCLCRHRHLRRPSRSHARSHPLLAHKGSQVRKGQALQAVQLVSGRVLQGEFRFPSRDVIAAC